MTNRQWLIWQMIELPPETMADKLDLDWFCENHCVSADDCNNMCRGQMIKWLKQEHDENEHGQKY